MCAVPIGPALALDRPAKPLDRKPMSPLLAIRSAILVLLTVSSCGGSSKPAAEAPRTAPSGDPSCPVAVAGTSVTVEDSDTGAALVFVTTGDLAELRRRVAAMAQMHNDHHAAMAPLPEGGGAGS